MSEVCEYEDEFFFWSIYDYWPSEFYLTSYPGLTASALVIESVCIRPILLIQSRDYRHLGWFRLPDLTNNT